MSRLSARETMATLRTACRCKQKSPYTMENKLDAILEQLITMNSRLIALSSKIKSKSLIT